MCITHIKYHFSMQVLALFYWEILSSFHYLLNKMKIAIEKNVTENLNKNCHWINISCEIYDKLCNLKYCLIHSSDSGALNFLHVKQRSKGESNIFMHEGWSVTFIHIKWF